MFSLCNFSILPFKYWIVSKNVFNNSQDIVLTLGIITLVANIDVEGVLMKE
jgi:hypothetical protein